jgi:hypothetical protein
MSIHGDRVVNGAGRSGVWKINSAQIIWVQVVPLFDGEPITMSPGRNSNPSHRVLSSIGVRYRASCSVISRP